MCKRQRCVVISARTVQYSVHSVIILVVNKPIEATITYYSPVMACLPRPLLLHLFAQFVDLEILGPSATNNCAI